MQRGIKPHRPPFPHKEKARTCFHRFGPFLGAQQLLAVVWQGSSLFGEWLHLMLQTLAMPKPDPSRSAELQVVFLPELL